MATVIVKVRMTLENQWQLQPDGWNPVLWELLGMIRPQIIAVIFQLLLEVIDFIAGELSVALERVETGGQLLSMMKLLYGLENFYTVTLNLSAVTV